MPHPAAFDSDARSPYDAGLTYDFFGGVDNGDGGAGDASRLGFAFALIPGLISEGSQLISSVGTSLNAEDKRRLARANKRRDEALAGSVLAAQVVLGAPDQVSGNEQHFWRDAATAIQQQRPDVWSEALAAGPYWPVGADFDMTALSQQIAQQLSSASTAFSNIRQTVNSAVGASGGSTGTAAAGAARVGAASALSNPIILIGGAVAVIALATKRGRR